MIVISVVVTDPIVARRQFIVTSKKKTIHCDFPVPKMNKRFVALLTETSRRVARLGEASTQMHERKAFIGIAPRTVTTYANVYFIRRRYKFEAGF